jgi:signal transduction histidine kinase
VTELPPQSDDGARLGRTAGDRTLAANPDTAFERIARLASLALGTTMASIGVLDESRIRFKAFIGMEVESVPRVGALCNRLLGMSEPLVVTDTLADPVFREATLVRDAPHVRFYAGVPLRDAAGVHLGSLCVMDTRPLPMPDETQIAIIKELAGMALAELAVQDTGHAGHSIQSPAPPASGLPESTHRNLLAAYSAKSEFLSSLSHELRTPLNAIVGYGGLIAGSDDTPPATAEHAGEIMAAARHMLALVNDILEYSRLEAGNLPIGWQRVLVGPIVEAALRMVSVFATSRGIHLTRDLAWPDAATRGDPVRLKQVLLNLLTNAIKFTPRGGEVTVRLAPAADNCLEISVTDTGIGISDEDISKTLTPFGQIVPKEGGHIEGTGLGLPIAKALIERQGGTLSLESSLGQGTTVRVLLPALFPVKGGDEPSWSGSGSRTPALP